MVLYNPAAEHYTMPLALVAIASGLDSRLYAVHIVDARLEANPHRTLLDAAAGALVVGVTVLTGAPLWDALQASRALKAAHPRLPVVWGGWHPSLFPQECAREAAVDAVVGGQGELAFQRIVESLVTVGALPSVSGAPARVALDELPPHDYGLLPVERYFALKGRRQLDYHSSQGCPYRCGFCADPAVFKRRWSGLSAERMLHELAELHRRYAFREVAFQDELFFVDQGRALDFAQGHLAQGAPFSWTATLRADQAARMSEAAFRVLAESRLREVLIGVESGDPDTLARIDKDLTLEQVEVAADRCARHGVGALFPFIVGFPGETEASVEKTHGLAARLVAKSPRFAVRIFSYQPYPGSPLYEAAATEGPRSLPGTLDEWGRFDFVGARGPWTSAAKHARSRRVEFYANRAWSRRATLAGRVVGRLARWRTRLGVYSVPVEMWAAAGWGRLRGARRRGGPDRHAPEQASAVTTGAGCPRLGPGGR